MAPLFCATHRPTTTRNAFGFQRNLFTYFLAVLILHSPYIDATSTMVVSRNTDGDDFTNPRSTQSRSCDEFNALCVDDLLKSCSECRCHAGNETYRFDLQKCVSRLNLDNYSGMYIDFYYSRNDISTKVYGSVLLKYTIYESKIGNILRNRFARWEP